MRPKASWAIDSEPIRARRIIVKYPTIVLAFSCGWARVVEEGPVTPFLVDLINFLCGMN